MGAWTPGCWHRLYPPEVLERFYREKARRQARPSFCDDFLCPGYRPLPPEEPAPAPRPDALHEVVATIVEALLPALVPRLVELLPPALEKRVAITAARIAAEVLRDRQ